MRKLLEVKTVVGDVDANKLLHLNEGWEVLDTHRQTWALQNDGSKTYVTIYVMGKYGRTAGP